MKVDVCQNRANQSPLRRANQACLFDSVKIHISCIQELPDQIQKPLILDLLLQDGDEGMVIQFVEAGTNISFDKPIGRGPISSKFAEGGVATAVGSKPVTGVPEIGFLSAV